MTTQGSLLNVALFHPWPRQKPEGIGNWLKNILLFFDGVALLAPPKSIDKLTEDDRATVSILCESGLLHLLDPIQLMDGNAADRLMDFLLVNSTSRHARATSDLEFLPWVSRTLPDEDFDLPALQDWLIRDKLPDEILDYAKTIWHELFVRGLAVDARSSHPSFLNPHVWATIERHLAYALRARGLVLGMDLQPATDNEAELKSTMQLLGRSMTQSPTHVVESGPHEVAPDLRSISLDEVLDFRVCHGKQYREYVDQLRLFMTQFSLRNDHERLADLATRRAELIDMAHALRRNSLAYWRRPVARMQVAIVGRAWKASDDQEPSATVAFIGDAVGTPGSADGIHSTYSYLFKERRGLL